MPKKTLEDKYISLLEAAKYYNCTQQYLNLMARQGRLKAIKMGRNWVTTKEWLEEYAQAVKKDHPQTSMDNFFK